MSIEAMKQALEALENASDIMDSYAQKRQDDAITSLRQAIAEAEKQEPVAWANRALTCFAQQETAVCIKPLAWFKKTPLQRQPLTHEQRLDLLRRFEPNKNKWDAHAILIDMIEAAHGIKE
jgi:hypothetical protein